MAIKQTWNVETQVDSEQKVIGFEVKDGEVIGFVRTASSTTRLGEAAVTEEECRQLAATLTAMADLLEGKTR